jgi:tetratricopeptide (TPR) repeat protein
MVKYGAEIPAACALAIACLLCGVARADDLEDARRHARNGSSAFELGNFDEAIREYTAAYKLKSDPAILYNLAQAHRIANHPSEALHFYKMFLSRMPEAPNRAEVTAKIEALVKLVEEQRQTQSMPSELPIREEPRAPPEMTAPSPPPASRAERPIYKRAWFWGVIGAVVAAGVGIGLGVGLGAQPHPPGASEGTVRF